MKRYKLLALILSITVALACGCAKKPSPNDKVLVKVSNSVITVGDFNSRIEKLPPYYKNMVEKNKKRYLEEMIAEKLFYEEALRKGINNDKEVAEILREAKKKIVITKLIKNEIEDKTKVSEAQIRAFYEANKDKLKTPEMWRASHILVATEEEANNVLQELKSGAKFEDLARARSKDATAERGGDIGNFRAGQLVPEFEKATIALNVGELSGVVHTKFGYHIIKLTDKKAPGVQTYEKAKPLIETEL
ncbi:MAG: peptidylprolyl isomerase, partial [Candidatus Omnitrophota bacterium]